MHCAAQHRAVAVGAATSAAGRGLGREKSTATNSPRLAYTGKTGELLTEEQLATSTLVISHGSGEVE